MVPNATNATHCTKESPPHETLSRKRRVCSPCWPPPPCWALPPLPAVRAQEGQETGTWAFSYPDNTKPGAVLDLRYLNETVAGQSGFVRLSPGRQLVRARATASRSASGPAATTTTGVRPKTWRRTPASSREAGRQHGPPAHADRAARRRADHGRQREGDRRHLAHGRGPEERGHLRTISPYWANGKKVSQWGIDGYTGQTDLWGLLFFNEKLQAGYKAWVKALYTRPNPYTGIPLAKDPAVAIIQVQNEDGMFFWTMQGMKPEQQALLGQKFAAWLTAKYGSPDAAKAAWAGAADRRATTGRAAKSASCRPGSSLRPRPAAWRRAWPTRCISSPTRRRSGTRTSPTTTRTRWAAASSSTPPTGSRPTRSS